MNPSPRKTKKRKSPYKRETPAVYNSPLKRTTNLLLALYLVQLAASYDNAYFTELNANFVQYEKEVSVQIAQNLSEEKKELLNRRQQGFETADVLVGAFERKVRTIPTVGKGAFGSIYKVNVGKTPFSVKQMYYNKERDFEDFDSEGKESINEQNFMALQEVLALEFANKQDPLNHFFIKTYGALEMHRFFTLEQKELTKQERLRRDQKKNEPKLGPIPKKLSNLVENYKKNSKSTDPLLPTEAWFVMDYQRLSLFNYLDLNAKKGAIAHFGTRLEVALNLAKGLSLIHDDYYHCDLKPQNVMLRQVKDEDEVNEIRDLDPTELGQQAKVPLLMQLFGKGLYVVQMIDLGNEEPPGDKRKCAAGSPGFSPPEFGVKKSFPFKFDDEKFDVFSLFAMVVDAEFVELGLGLLSLYAGIFNKYFLDEKVNVRLVNFTNFLKSNKNGFAALRQNKLFQSVEGFLAKATSRAKTAPS